MSPPLQLAPQPGEKPTAQSHKEPDAGPIRALDPALRPYYGQPSPPRTFLMGGLGWAYGIGCGAGPFFGMGIAINRAVVFGAGAGVGVFCGVGFGTGAVVGHGHGFVPLGLNSSFFYAPRLGWAEDVLERYNRRQKRLSGRKESGWTKKVRSFWESSVWPRIAPVVRRRGQER